VIAQSDWTVSDLKEALASAESIPAEQQRLYRGAAELTGHARLDESFPLGRVAEIHLVRRKPENAWWLSRVATKGMSLAAASSAIRKDREVALRAVAESGRALQFVPEILRKDKGVVLAAVRQDGYALRFAAKELTHDSEVVLEAVKQNGLALNFAAHELKQELPVVLAAAEQNGIALQFASDILRKDRQCRSMAAETTSESFDMPSTHAQFAASVSSSRSGFSSARLSPNDGRWPSCTEWSPYCHLSSTQRKDKKTPRRGKRRQLHRPAIQGGLIFIDDLNFNGKLPDLNKTSPNFTSRHS
jgi:hypothetical protein